MIFKLDQIELDVAFQRGKLFKKTKSEFRFGSKALKRDAFDEYFELSPLTKSSGSCQQGYHVTLI